MIRRNTWTRALTALAFAGATFLAPSGASASLSILNFDVAQITVLQGSGNAFSGYLGWTPRMDVGSFQLKLDAGASLLTNGTSKFIAARGQLLAGFGLSGDLSVEVGPGMQMWMEGNANDATPLFAGANVRYKMSEMLDPFVSYSSILIPGALTHEFRIGTGLHF
jgi:hypothetical protein